MDNKTTPGSNISERSGGDGQHTELHSNGIHHDNGAPPADSTTARLARLVLEDYVVTTLLKTGRALRGDELAGGAEGFTLSRGALREGLEGSKRVYPIDREWQLELRTRDKALSREERARQPIESSLEALLREIGKPLPLPVVVRELAIQRSVYPETIRDVARNVLRTARHAIEVADSTWLHDAYTLDAGAPREELILHENDLSHDPDYLQFKELDVAPTGDLADRAAALLHYAGRPISQKLLGFLIWRQEPRGFDRVALAKALSDRNKFYNFVGGYVTTVALLPDSRAAVQVWLHELSGTSAEGIDVVALLRQRVAPAQVLAPQPGDIDEVKRFADQLGGRPFSIATIVTDLFEMEASDPQFAPFLQGLNDELRRDQSFLAAGIGRFLLRDAVPSYVGEVPDELRPIHLTMRDPETDEPLDFEMSDEGLEGDAPDFIHSPNWEDVNEEVEVKLPRRPAGDIPETSRYVILSHHHQSGTVKLRRMDEDFFALEGPLVPLDVRAEDGATVENLQVWASRESGLLYGLGEWYIPRTPESGGVLEFSRAISPTGGVTFKLKRGEPDKLTRIEGHRAETLETMRESSAYLSLFELLQTIMNEHQNGMELPTLWAEANMVRRTTKRLICSVLSGYHCFYFKQRGQNQFLWRFDDGKLDQGFKRNKRKYVRR